MQWWTMALMLLSGLGMGAVFDSYRVVSTELKFPKWWLPFLDLAYWIAAALIVFRVLYASNNGEVRIYVFLGLFVGVLVYYFLLSKAVSAIVRWLIEAVRTLIRLLLKTLEWTIVKPLLLLYKLARVILGFATAITIFLLKLVVQLLRPFWLLAKWIVGPIARPLIKRAGPYASRLQLASRAKGLAAKAGSLWNRWFKRSKGSD
ncbi:spore cortex biosynthesis protein YabQ [Paenibacillus protaetiae]|uniref:Spore cortex biosynthesis protein YabQ n=2 Tax=Paenibacillus protaetiae TaxID=2509456 RepID=A0A4P6F2Z4_9BACL|nr:spore cortex biosynthesis protein YabQ [Paenibacillus protaetiae]